MSDSALNDIKTPPGPERKRAFGANRMRVGRRTTMGGDRQYSESAVHKFALVADDVTHRPRSNGDEVWGDVPDFDFSSRERLPAPSHATAKYAKPKRPTTIITPGAAIIQGESHLTHGFNPPKKQNNFLQGITSSSVKHNVNRVVKLKAASSLEQASAPSPQLKRHSPHLAQGTSGWTNTRPVAERITTRPKPRVSLKDPPSSPPRSRSSMSVCERLSSLESGTRRSTRLHPLPSSESKATRFHGSPGRPLTNAQVRASLRDRSSATTSMISPGMPTRSSTRRAPTMGSALQPISLDSDSEECESPPRKKPNTNGPSPVPPVEMAKSPESTIDLDEVETQSVVQIKECDVLIGLFQCNATLFFQNDRVCISNIRGNHEAWPFKSTYFLSFPKLREARVFLLSKRESDDNGEDSPATPQPDETPFVALCGPFADDGDATEMNSFCDPTSSEMDKKFIIFRPSELANASSPIQKIVDIIRGCAEVELIDQDDCRQYLSVFDREPFSFASTRRQSLRKQKKQDSEELANSQDESSDGNDETMLTYPLPPCSSDIVTIIRRDILRLKPERYLNDNVIDYYFKRLMLDTFRDNPLIQERVLFLSSHFYSRLRTGQGNSAGSRLEAGYKNVSKWVARADFFKRSMIFIPINKDLHWSLAVILNPRLAATKPQHEDDACSCVAVLDPLGSYHRRSIIIRHLKGFLQLEWENSQSANAEQEAAPAYAQDQVQSVGVNAPRQENSYDCGVFVLKFAEVILQNCLQLRVLESEDGTITRRVVDGKLEMLIPPDAFAQKDIDATRIHIRQCIEADMARFQEIVAARSDVDV